MSNIFELDDRQLIERFVQGSNQLLASDNLRLEVTGSVSQLMSRTGDTIAIMYLQHKPRTVIVKNTSNFLKVIDRLLIDRDFVMFGNASRDGFTEYKHYVTPAGYKLCYTDPSILWKKWWPTERFQDKQRFNMDILVNVKDNWYPVQNIIVNAGTFTIKTIAGQLVLKRDRQVLWLAQSNQEQSETNRSTATPQLAEQSPNIGEDRDRLSPTDLAKKIQQKQATITPEQAWKLVKDLEQKLQSQIQHTTELDEKLVRAEHRALIAEQRLQIVYKYLHQIGVEPQDIYTSKASEVK